MAAQAGINRLPSFLKLISNSSDALDKPDLEDSGTLTIAMTKPVMISQFVDKLDLEDSATRTTQLGVNLAGDQPSMEQINKKRTRYSALATGGLFTLFLDEDQESTKLTNKKRKNYHPIQKHHNWAELPVDALSIIFQKIGFFEVLVSAQQVCRSWRELALDSSALCWRCIDMRCLPDVDSQSQDATSCYIKQENLTKSAIDRSGGHVEELCLMSVTDDLLTCITNRTSRLRCCTLICVYQIKPKGWFNFFSRCHQLEKLHVYQCLFSHESYKCIGLACSQLKCLHIDWILRKQEFHCDSEDEYDDLCRVRRKYPDNTVTDFDLDFGRYCSSESDSNSELYPCSDLDGEFFQDASFDPEPDSNSRKFLSIDDKMVPEKANMSIPSCGSEVALHPRFMHEMGNNPNNIDDNMASKIAIVMPIPSDTNLELYPDFVDSRSKHEPETKFDSFDDSVALEITDNMSIPSSVSDLDPYSEIGPDPSFEHEPKPNFGSIDGSVTLKITNNMSIPSRDSDLELYPDVGLDLRFECEPTLNPNPENDILALEITNNISIPSSVSNLDHYLDVGLDLRFESEPDRNFDSVDDSLAPEMSDNMSIPTGDSDLELYPNVGPEPIYEYEPALNSISEDDRVALEIADSVRQLRDLHLFRNFNLTNKWVHAILDKCLHPESLKISCCFDVCVDEALQVKLSKIKFVRLSSRSQCHQQCN